MNTHAAMPPYHEAELQNQGIGNDGLSLISLASAAWRRKMVVIVPVLLVFFGTLLVLANTESRYTSSASILVDTPQAPFSRPNQENNSIANPDSLAIGSHEQLLLSRDLARGVTLRFGLADVPEFQPSGRNPSFIRQMMILVGLASSPGEQTNEEKVIGKYFSRLAVARVDESRVIEVAFSSSDPELAAEIANGVVDNYLASLREARRQSTNEAALWLEEQIDQLRGKVETAEAMAASYRSEHGLLRGANNATLSSQQLSELNSQLILARTSRAESQARAQIVREMLASGGALGSASDVLNSPLIQRLQEQEVILRRRIAELSTTLLPSHPRIMQLDAELTDLGKQIRIEGQKVVQALENEADIAGARENALRANLNSLRQDAGRSDGNAVALRALEREATAQRVLLESFLARYREATAQSQLEALPVQARIISRAAVSSNPSFPRRIPILAMTSLGTAFLAMALIFSIELMKVGASLNGNQSNSRLPVPENLDIRPVAETAPRVNDAVNFVPASTDADGSITVSNAVQDVIGAIYRRISPGEATRTFVCAPQRQSPDNFSALNIARGLALDGHKVVLIDGNMRASRLAIQTGLAGAPGFSDLLTETHDFVHVLQRDPLSRVHIIAGGSHVLDPVRMIRHDRLEQILDALEGTYNHIVIDGPPALLASEAQILASCCDSAVIVPDTLPGGQKMVERTQDVLTNNGRQPIEMIETSSIITELDVEQLDHGSLAATA